MLGGLLAELRKLRRPLLLWLTLGTVALVVLFAAMSQQPNYEYIGNLRQGEVNMRLHPPTASELGVQPGSPDAMPVADAPKPPPDRVTLSAARLSRSRAVLFLVSGDGKREALQRWQRGESIPAAAIRPPGGVDVLVEASLLEARAVDPRP